MRNRWFILSGLTYLFNFNQRLTTGIFHDFNWRKTDTNHSFLSHMIWKILHTIRQYIWCELCCFCQFSYGALGTLASQLYSKQLPKYETQFLSSQMDGVKYPLKPASTHLQVMQLSKWIFLEGSADENLPLGFWSQFHLWMEKNKEICPTEHYNLDGRMHFFRYWNNAIRNHVQSSIPKINR